MRVNDYDESEWSRSSDYDILGEHNETITLNGLFWLEINKETWYVNLIEISYNDKEEDEEYLKILWMNTKKNKGYYKNCLA